MGHELPEFTDKANCAGVNKVLTIPASSIVELKVGASVLEKREFVEFQALDVGIKWGFGGGAGEQVFDCFKSQTFTRPFGPLVSIYFLNTKVTSVEIAIGEIS